MADIIRKITRAVAVLAVALGAGHLVQNMSKSDAPSRLARTEVLPEPKAIQTVAATEALPTPAPQPKPALIEPIAAVAPAGPPGEKMPAPIILAATGATEPLAETPPAKAAPPLVLPAAPLAAAPQTAPPAAAATQLADACAVTLDLMADANAMIGLTLQAPCHANERVIVKHAGLAVSAMTTANGALFTGVPAFETKALVEVVFADGHAATASIVMPEVAQLRRFGVQWQADDAFQVHAFENGSGYGDAGHISGADPHRPVTGLASSGGFLTLLGDSTAQNPLLAEIFTFPANPNTKAEVIVEAAVTKATCGRELLGETLNAIGGEVYVTDLTLAMPDCAAIGDYMVLKNLVLDLSIAAAE